MKRRIKSRIHWWLNTLELRYGDVPILGRVIWWAFTQWQRVM